MSQVSFAVQNFHSSQLKRADLPVEVRRRHDLSLAARTLLSERVSLDPGDYLALVRLPGGPEIHRAFEVGNEPRSKIQLDVAPESISVSEALEPYNYLSSSVMFTEPTRVDEDYEEHLTFTAYQGNVFEPDSLRTLDFKPSINAFGGSSQYRTVFHDPGGSGSKGPLLLKIEWVGLRPLIVCLPVVKTLVFELSNADGTGAITFDIHLENPAAEAMLGYMQTSDWSSAAPLSYSRQLSAEQLLQLKLKDPIGAAVGAYALLRLAQLDRLHDWTENLQNWFPWLPDGCAIRGEHLARLGKHQPAVDSFLKLRDRGLPIFQDGISYAAGRLGQYLESASPRARRIGDAQELLSQLRRFHRYVKYDQTVTMYEAADPLYPEAERVESVTDLAAPTI